MTEADIHDLGCGVQVRPQGPTGWIVESPHLVLDWRPRAGPHVGTAVFWGEAVFEVMAVQAAAVGQRWVIEPWPEGEAIRVSFELTSESIAAHAAEQQTTLEERRERTWLTIASPFVGFLPTDVQRRLENRLGFRAARATALSALMELALGSVLAVQFMMARVGGTVFLPEWMARYSILGAVLWVESMIRLTMVWSSGDPIGSILGLPALLFMRSDRKVKERPSDAPGVRRFDPEEGVLELVSPVMRRDWDTEAGVLEYRGTSFSPSGFVREGRDWVYSFARSDGDAEAEAVGLRLLPPRIAPAEKPAPDPNVKPLQTTIRSALMCFAPAEEQRRWAASLKMSPLWLTAGGAMIEIFGGFMNLPGDLLIESSWWIFDVYIIAEGLVRLGSVAFTSRPMGTVFGVVVMAVVRRRAKSRR